MSSIDSCLSGSGDRFMSGSAVDYGLGKLFIIPYKAQMLQGQPAGCEHWEMRGLWLQWWINSRLQSQFDATVGRRRNQTFRGGAYLEEVGPRGVSLGSESSNLVPVSLFILFWLLGGQWLCSSRPSLHDSPASAQPSHSRASQGQMTPLMLWALVQPSSFKLFQLSYRKKINLIQVVEAQMF